jgi:parallel beta-helix repeat protein
MIRKQHLAAFVFAACAATALPAAAAESFDSCEGRYIDSLPTTISTPGTWCLRRDASTAIVSGAAIQVASNNVTIDCNGYKLGGLAAGPASMASGISSAGRSNVTVRNCAVRGFYYGIQVEGGGGHLVEGNRLDNNLLTGIRVSGDNSRVRDNAVYDTGGALGRTDANGIVALADVTGNTVSGVFALEAPSYPVGIVQFGAGHVVGGNVVRNITPNAGGMAYGIVVSAVGVTVEGNRVAAPAPVTGLGIAGYGATNTFCLNNTVAHYSAPIVTCRASSSNDSFQ